MTQETILWLLGSLCVIVILELLYLGSRFRESLAAGGKMKKNTVGSPINETPQTGTPLVISTGDDLSRLEWTDEKRKELEDALEVIRQYDIERMNEALKTPVTEAPKDLTREEKRDLILRQATALDIHEAAKVGNACMEYWKEHGKFPENKDDIEDNL